MPAALRNPGIQWNMLRHSPGHPLSPEMLLGLLKTKENIIEWASRHEELSGSSLLEFMQIFALCYDDLQFHLRSCVIHLANFPEDVEISTEKLYQIWMAAGFIGSDHNNDLQTRESRIYLLD